MDQKVRRIIVIALLIIMFAGISIMAPRFANSGGTGIDGHMPDLVLSDGEVIKPWYNKADSVYYYFIPSYADIDAASLVSNDKKLDIDGKRICDGETLTGFDVGKTYSLKDSEENETQNIQFRKSESVATIYIRTANESLDKVMDSRGVKEIARVIVVDVDGNIDVDTTDSKIKSRGSSTWYKPKKSLSVLFEKQTSVLGMGASDKWALISNVMDHSGIRNKMVYDAATEIGLGGTPETKYVDLYLNGEYRGLYLICQTPDTFYQWSDVDEEDLYLFTAALPSRESNAAYPIWVQNNEALIDVCLPENMHADERNTAESIVRKLDKEIMSGADNLADVIDLDSWVKKYLLDEVFINFDSGIASAYFYSSPRSEDSKVYAGPIWDYDNALGNSNGFSGTTDNPEILFAKSEYKASGLKILWYSDLYNNPIFYSRVIEVYKDAFVPIIGKLLEGGIEEYQKQISAANANNDLRWNIDSQEDTSKLKDYLTKRYAFLNSVWQEGEEYCEIIGIDPSNKESYMMLYVKKGESPSQSEYYEQLFGKSTWYMEENDAKFDSNMPVTKDIIIRKGKAVELGMVSKVVQTIKEEKGIVEVAASLFAMLCLLFILSKKRLKI